MKTQNHCKEIIMQNKQTLITAVKGKTSSRVAKMMEQAGLPYRGVSRSSNIPFDWYDPSTWNAALEGVKSAYLVFLPDLAVPGSIEIITAFTELAKKKGLKKLVLLSGRGEEEALKCEQIVLNCGIPSTVVRASWFAQNFSEYFWLGDVLKGQITIPENHAKEPFIDIDDIAEVVFAALTEEGHEGKTYEVSGPELLSFAEVAQKFSEGLERPVEINHVPMAEFKDSLSKAQVPQDVVDLLEYLFTEVLDGRNAYISNGVEEALGRPATSFNQFINKTRNTGVWA
jgi:uncharacterized protein YbjT (DUF2867 family)